MRSASGIRIPSFIFALMASIGSCHQNQSTTPLDEPQGVAENEESESVRYKIEFDLEELDEQGFTGPVDGMRPIHYEFKIPKSEELKREVSAIDPSVKFMPKSRGRIGTNENEILCFGSTDQPGHKEILLRLAALPYIERIIVCYFE